MSHIFKRLDRILNTLKETGVIKAIKLNGREAANKMDTQLLIDMSDDYVSLYNINKWEHEATRLRKQLEAPLNLQYMIGKKK